MHKKKSLGQHFLRSPYYLKLIADAAQIVGGEHVLEIGPGEGTLTAELLSRGAIVSAVEKDHRLIPLLQEKFKTEIAEKRFFLHEADALEFDIKNLQLKTQNWKLVGNIPYYITGALLRTFLSGAHQPSTIVFLIQKEVAERIARSSKESILSLSIKAYGEPKYIKTVPSGAFSPPPAVDSAILAITNISRQNFEDIVQEEKFFALIHAGFAQKRKLLKRNLESVLGTPALEALQNAHIPENARAEDVALPQWLSLSHSRDLP